MTHKLRTLALLGFWTAALLLSVKFVAAQSFQLSGKVTQQNGTPFVGATVEVINPANNSVVANATTDMTGNYSLWAWLF